MRKSKCVIWTSIFIGVSGFFCSSASAVETKTKEADIPGSGVMPPKIKEGARPPKPAKFGQVKLGVWIREDGTVDQVEVLAGVDAWNEACVSAAKQIKFEPVMWEGRAILARTEVIYAADSMGVNMSTSPLPNLPGEVHTEEEFGLTKPLVEVDPDLILPLLVRASGKRVEAGMSFVIQEDGSTDKIEILGASSEAALRSGLDIIAERKYQPAKIREELVTTQYRQVLGFQSLEKPIAALQGAVDIVDPAYPYEQLLAQEEGNATVRFTLGANGSVKTVELVEASHPDFGAALVAAAESWLFRADAAVEQPVREYRHDFLLANASYASRRLIATVREGKKISNASAGLDAKPKPLARPSLAYPTALFDQSISGSAQIEFVIDRVGLAQLPRVVKATQPAFGWAAVTMINGMRFQPLTRGGKPTELRVVIPITFEPPKKESSTPAG
jgi:TonB family protein